VSSGSSGNTRLYVISASISSGMFGRTRYAGPNTRGGSSLGKISMVVASASAPAWNTIVSTPSCELTTPPSTPIDLLTR
jgi:hypothetical protein